jgi:hypothetical protein
MSLCSKRCASASINSDKYWRGEIPVLSNDKATLSRVFGEYPIDVDSAPRDTTLRRAILDWMRAGGRMCSASGFILIS